jgi:hypothetical protein
MKIKYINCALLTGLLLSGCISHERPRQPPVQFCWDPFYAFYEPYVIKKGDTLLSIARQNEDPDTLDRIITRNGIIDPNRIYCGQTIYIPSRDKSKDKKAQPSSGGNVGTYR